MSSQPAVPRAFADLPTSLHASSDDGARQDDDARAAAALAAGTAQRVAEEALRRQTQALALAVHELRDPLTPISNVAMLLGQVTAVDQLPRLSAIIQRQVAHMTRLIDDLLDAARMGTGKLHLHRTRLDLREVFETALNVCAPAMGLRRQSFALRVPDRPLILEGDLVRLTQVFTNLLNNAAKYTPLHGAIALDCSINDLGEAVVAVSDSGIGISPEALPLIWEPFVQDALAIGFSKQGLGIGLTLVRELVQAHGGSVAAASAGEGRGSVFMVVLPLA